VNTRIAAIICVTPLLAGAALAQPVELTNEHITIAFDPDDGYAVCSLVNHAQDVEFIEPRPEGDAEQDRSPWGIDVRSPSRTVSVTAADAGGATHNLDGDTLTITWTGIGNDEMPGDLTVTATVRLPEDSAKAYWRCEVSGQTTGWLWQVDFPRIFGIRDFPDSQMTEPLHWGRLVRKPIRQGRPMGMGYPEPMSMQWVAYWGVEDDRDPPLAQEEGRNPESGWSPDYSDAAGLYWATEDGELYWKIFYNAPDSETGQLAWRIGNIPGLPDWPMPAMAEPVEVGYEMPYEVVTAVFTGDYHEAAAIYRDWARDQDWTRRGPMDEWPDEMPDPGSDELTRWTPPWFRDIGFWAKFYHEPAKILPEWAAYRKWLGVPIASHWYRYNIARFNDNDPEHLPPDPYLLDGVRAARELGVEPMPYVLSTIWDTDTQSWIRENGLRGAVKTPSGEILPWVIGNNVFAWMCMSTEQWHAKMREICEKLIWEHGMSGVYLDVLTAGSAKPCYDPSHGHSIRGGSYWGQGARTLMRDLRADIRRLDPDACFFSEGIGEHVIDLMDGFLTLDLTRSYTPGGEQVWPILTAVYNPYTINFGSDAQIGQDPEHFAVLYGRQLVWGSQPLHSVILPPMPEEGDTTSEIFREYTRAYYVAGQPWLMGGTMLRMAVRPKNAADGRCGLELAADEHTVSYDLRRDRLKIWTGPAVLASAWERFGDIGIVMANITGEAQDVNLMVRGDVLGLDGERMVRLWPGQPETIGEAAGEHSLTLEPWRCAVYAITGDPDTAMARLNELEEMPWQLEVVEDGPIPAVTGLDGSLFACSDGPVLNESGDGGTVATAYHFDAEGTLKPREGHQAEQHGHEVEGHGLPRNLDEQPFALLRRLPHTATLPQRGIMVLSGDRAHLLAVVSGRAELGFSAPGLLMVTRADDGEAIRPLSAGLAQSVSTPEDEEVIVAWARFGADEVGEMLAFGDEAIRERMQPFADRLVGLMSCPAEQRDAELAAASRQFVEVAQSFRDLPGALSPVGPLTRLHERMNALLTARLAMHVVLDAEHRWLAPRVDKPLSLLVLGGEPESEQIIPVGFWAEGGFAVEQPGGTVEAADRLVARPTVRLDDASYVERAIPVLGVANVARDGQSWALTDILRLEANRPYQLIYAKDAITVVAGQPRTTSITVRNWSPLDLDLSLSGSGPEGWEVTPAVARIASPALSDTEFEVSVQAPEDAPRGGCDVQVISNHSTDEDTGFIAVLPVSVLDALRPMMQQVAEWERPDEESRARIRNDSKFAIYADAGEEIAITIRNVRVTHYVDTLSWRLFRPDMSLIDEGRVAVDESTEIAHTAADAGTYYLEVVPKMGSADVIVANRPVAEVATEQDQLKLFCSEITRFFFVPAGSEGFRLGARDGGPTETARFVITSPTGRVAFEADGNYNGVEFPVEVRPDEAAKTWTIRVEPEQDLSFWLSGDVMPYLSSSPERMLVAAGAL